MNLVKLAVMKRYKNVATKDDEVLIELRYSSLKPLFEDWWSQSGYSMFEEWAASHSSEQPSISSSPSDQS